MRISEEAYKNEAFKKIRKVLAGVTWPPHAAELSKEAIGLLEELLAPRPTTDNRVEMKVCDVCHGTGEVPVVYESHK